MIKDFCSNLSSFHDLTKSDRWKIQCRQPDLYDESPGSSEYSTGSTLVSHTAVDRAEQMQAEIGAAHQDVGQTFHIGDKNGLGECDKGILSGGTGSQGNVTSYSLKGW